MDVVKEEHPNHKNRLRSQSQGAGLIAQTITQSKSLGNVRTEKGVKSTGNSPQIGRKSPNKDPKSSKSSLRHSLILSQSNSEKSSRPHFRDIYFTPRINEGYESSSSSEREATYKRLDLSPSKNRASYSDPLKGLIPTTRDKCYDAIKSLEMIITELNNSHKDLNPIQYLLAFHELSGIVENCQQKLSSMSLQINNQIERNVNASSNSEKKAKNHENLHHKERIIKELYETERHYVEILSKLWSQDGQSYFKTIKEYIQNNNNIVNSNAILSVIDLVFEPLEPMFNLHSQFLKALGNYLRLTSHLDIQQYSDIGSFLNEWIPKFEVSCDFAASSSENLKLIDRLFREHSSPLYKLGTTLVNLPSNVVVPFLSDLRSNYVAPIQRFPRYEMLIKDLLKKTDDDQIEYVNISNALNSITRLNQLINEKVAQKENEVLLCKLRGDKKIKHILYDEEDSNTEVRELISFLSVDHLYDASEKTAVSIPLPKDSEKNKILLFNDQVVSLGHITNSLPGGRITLPLVWVDVNMKKVELEDYGIPVEGDSDILLYIKISGPREVWIAKSSRDSFINWSTRLKTYLNLQESQEYDVLQHGCRDGSSLWYEWPQKGFYSGTWRYRKPSGKGMFKRFDNEIFDGVWDAEGNIGFGAIKSFIATIDSPVNNLHDSVVNYGISHTERKGVWTSKLHSGGNVVELEKYVDNLFFLNRQISTDGNLESILASGTSERYNEGEFIFEEGQTVHFYILQKGSVMLKRGTEYVENVPNIHTSYDVSKVELNQLFGYGCDGRAFLSAFCEDATEVVSLNPNLLSELLTTDVQLAFRFAYHTASTLRIQERLWFKNNSKTIQSDCVPVLKLNIHSPTDEQSMNKKFRSIFNLSQSEKIFKVVRANAEGGLFRSGSKGHLILTDSHICYLQDFFGIRIKEKINYSRILKVKNNKKSFELHLTQQFDNSGLHIKFRFKSQEQCKPISTLARSLWSYYCSQPELSAHSARSSSNTYMQSMSAKHLQWLREGAVKEEYMDGFAVIKQGHPSQAFYQVYSGQLSVVADGITLAILNPGDVFGESVFLDNEKSSASVIAKGDVTLYSVSFDYVNLLFLKDPSFPSIFYWYLTELIARRIVEKFGCYR
eukprot:TRINITY_DN749_c0_g2_i3.p1 TRINITY_DN749_c0_g2~~TRINITY_DN749_c0_g2_i3.p1  ORF type:complete len:1121 (-),score=183.56 TRINITY_DN749_c0_g2_i3:46-3408(-)